MITLKILLILLLFLIFVKVSIDIRYIKKNKSNLLLLKVSILNNLIRFNKTIALSKQVKEKSIKVIKKSKVKKKIKKKSPDTLSLEDNLKKIHLIYNIIKDTFSASTSYIKKKIILELIIVKIDFGIDDAAVTGITSGLVWGTTYNLLSVLNNNINIKNIDIEIQPNFNKFKLDIVLGGIFTFRTVNIIIILCIIIYHTLKNYIKKLMFSYA